MNSAVLKGKLGAGFNDDRYMLPKDGNPGDILVKTETGSAWEKQRHDGSSRVYITGTMTNTDSGVYIATNETRDQIDEMYIGGKDVILEIGTGEDSPIRLSYNGGSFYSISALKVSNTIEEAGITLAGEPVLENSGQRRTLWHIGSFKIVK